MKISEMNVEYVDHMGSDLSVVNAARVSFNKLSEWEEHIHLDKEFKVLNDKDQKLIAYLARNNHWTPFAHTSITFRIKAPIFVARQLVKHQVGLVWNEVSRRYVDDEPEFWFPEEWRGKPVNAKQGSDGVITLDTRRVSPKEVVRGALLTYESLLEQDVAPEMARMILPQNTMTEWVWTGNVASFARVCKLRLDPHAQLETQMIAEKINDLMMNYYPISWKELMK